MAQEVQFSCLVLFGAKLLEMLSPYLVTEWETALSARFPSLTTLQCKQQVSSWRFPSV